MVKENEGKRGKLKLNFLKGKVGKINGKEGKMRINNGDLGGC